MRRTRFMTWFFLVLSLAFFAARDFRAALEAPLLSVLPPYWKFARPEIYGKPGPLGRFWKFYSLNRYVSTADLERMAKDAERRGDSEFMAFAALHLPAKDRQEDILRLADGAVAQDAKLTWLYIPVILRLRDNWGTESVYKSLGQRIDRLRAWDPSNAAPYVLRAFLIRSEAERKQRAAASDQSKLLEVISLHLDWQRTVERVFTQPRYESYDLHRFELKRKIMREHRWNNPWVVLAEMNREQIVGFIVIDCAIFQVSRIGAGAEAAGRMRKAFDSYRQVARLGKAMRLQGHSEMDQLVGTLVQRIAYARLIPALRGSGQAGEAAVLDYNKELLDEWLSRRENPMLRTSNYGWSALLLSLSATVTWLFLVLSLLSVVYVNAKRWIRKERRGHLYVAMTIAENYASLILFISSLVLALCYAPYGQNFSYYMTVEKPLVPFLFRLVENSFPIFPGTPYTGSLPMQNPYGGYFYVALEGLLLLLLVSLLGRWRQARQAAAAVHPTFLGSASRVDWRLHALVLIVAVAWVSILAWHLSAKGKGQKAAASRNLLQREPAAQKEPHAALAAAQKALSLYRLKRDELSASEATARARELKNMGFTFELQRNLPQATRMYEHALAIFHEVGNLPEAAATADGLGVVLRAGRNFSAASKFYRQALHLYLKTGNQNEASRLLTRYAGALKRAADSGREQEIYRQAARICRAQHEQDSTGCALTLAGHAFESQEDFALARKMYQRALAILRQRRNTTSDTSEGEGASDDVQSDLQGLSEFWKISQRRKRLRDPFRPLLSKADARPRGT